MNKFQALGLNDAILQAVADMGFTEPSDVQEQAIPVLLKDDTDIVALAQTGTGKQQHLVFRLFKRLMQTVKLLKG